MGDFGGFIGLVFATIKFVSYQGSYIFVIQRFVQKLYFSKNVHSSKGGQTYYNYNQVSFGFKDMWHMIPIVSSVRQYLGSGQESDKHSQDFCNLAHRLDTELQMPRLLKRIQKLTALSLSLAQKDKSNGQANYEFDESILGIADQYYQDYIAVE